MALSSIDWRGTHARKSTTATTEAKTTKTTAVVVSATVAPQLHLLFVVILLNSNQFSLYYSTIVIIVNILLNSRERARVIFHTKVTVYLLKKKKVSFVSAPLSFLSSILPELVDRAEGRHVQP